MVVDGGEGGEVDGKGLGWYLSFGKGFVNVERLYCCFICCLE